MFAYAGLEGFIPNVSDVIDFLYTVYFGLSNTFPFYLAAAYLPSFNNHIIFDKDGASFALFSSLNIARCVYFSLNELPYVYICMSDSVRARVCVTEKCRQYNSTIYK